MSTNRKARFPKAVILAIAILAGLALPAESALAQARPVVTVASAAELLKAIGPNRVVQLRKGDYLLSTAYSVKSKYVDWLDSDEGKELVLKDLSGLTIKGQAGSRIIVDSATAYFLDLQDSSKVSLESLVFVRKIAEGAEVNAGGIYLENGGELSLSGISFEGGSGYPLELSDCTGVIVTNCEFSGGQYGALYASWSGDLSIKDSSFSGMEGYPLLSLEECSNVAFDTCGFSDNRGSTFVEIYAESGEAEAITFTGCDFTGNEFDYFAGPGSLPETLDCRFDSNSFDEDWMEYAVAPEQDSEYYGYGAEYATWDIPAAGLKLEYPAAWEVQEGDEGQVGFVSDTGEVMVVFSGLSTKVPANPSASQLKKVFSDAAVTLISLMRAEASVSISYTQRDDPWTGEDGLARCYAQGNAKKANGETGEVLIHFVLANGKVWMALAFAGDEELLAPGSDAASILDSLGPL